MIVLRAGTLRNHASFSCRGKTCLFLLLQGPTPAPGPTLAPILLSLRTLSSWIKAALALSWPLTVSAVEIKNMSKYCRTSVCQYGVHRYINPLNPDLNPICYLLALLGAHHFLHVSRIRVKILTFRRLMSYIYGAPILDVSRSHTTTQHSR